MQFILAQVNQRVPIYMPKTEYIYINHIALNKLLINDNNMLRLLTVIIIIIIYFYQYVLFTNDDISTITNSSNTNK